MVYQVPPAKKSKKQNRFEFQIGDDTYTLPAMKYLKPDTMADVESGSLAAMRAVFEEHAPGAFARLEDAEQMDALVGAWMEESKLSLGESEASADS